MKSEIWINDEDIYYAKMLGKVTECKVTALRLDMSKMSYGNFYRIDVSKAFLCISIHTPIKDVLIGKREYADYLGDFVLYKDAVSCYKEMKEGIAVGWNKDTDILYGPLEGTGLLSFSDMFDLKNNGIGNAWNLNNVMSWQDMNKPFLGVSWKPNFKLISWIIEDGEPKMTSLLAQSCNYDLASNDIFPHNAENMEGFYATKQQCLNAISKVEQSKEESKIQVIRFPKEV